MIPPGYYGSVPQQLPPFVIGGAVDADYQNVVNALVNAAPQALQTYTATVASAVTGTTYTMTVNGVAISYTAVSGDTTTTIAAALAALADITPTVGYFQYSPVSDVITATAISYGTDISITGTNVTVVETVAPASAEEVPFGCAVLNLQTFGPTNVPYGAIVSSANLQAQVRTITVAYTSGETYDVSITMPSGEVYRMATVTAASSLATLTTAIVTAINTVMPANTVLASSAAAGTVTLTAEIAGLAFTVAVSAQTQTNISVAGTTVGALTDINQCFAGIALANYTQPGTVVGVSQSAYVANSSMGIMAKGRVAVYSEQTVSAGDKVYVETSGASASLCYNTPSSTRLLLLACGWNPRPSFSSIDANILVLK